MIRYRAARASLGLALVTAATLATGCGPRGNAPPHDGSALDSPGMARALVMRHAARAVMLQHPDLATRAEHSAALVAEYRKSELVDTAWVAEDGSIFLQWKGDDVPSNVGDGEIPGQSGP